MANKMKKSLKEFLKHIRGRETENPTTDKKSSEE